MVNTVPLTLDTKKIYLWYFPTYLVVAALSIVLILIIPILDYLFIVIAIVLSWREASKIKGRGLAEISESDKKRFAALSGMGFIITPILYHLVLRNKYPQVAVFFSKLFGKMVLPIIILAIIIGFIIGFVGAMASK